MVLIIVIIINIVKAIELSTEEWTEKQEMSYNMQKELK